MEYRKKKYRNPGIEGTKTDREPDGETKIHRGGGSSTSTLKKD